MNKNIIIDSSEKISVLKNLMGVDSRRVGVPPEVHGARIAIAGLGRMGARHVKAAKRRRHVIAALIDPSPQPFAIADDPGLASYLVGSLDKISPSSTDVLVIATTADLHHHLACEAIEQGFQRIVIEKPVTQSVDQAIDIKLRAEAAGARVVVNHGRRYCEAYCRARRLKSEMGDVRSLTLRFGGGALGCVGTHWIDLANTIIDAEATTVFAAATAPSNNPRGERFVDPGASLMIFYDNGAVAFIDSRDDVGFMGGAWISFGRGELSWTDEFGPWTLRRRSASDAEKPLTQYGLPLFSTPFSPSETARLSGAVTWTYSVQEAVLGYAACAMDDALGDAPPISGIDAAIQTMRIFAAARLSGSLKRSVEIAALDDKNLAEVFPIP